MSANNPRNIKLNPTSKRLPGALGVVQLLLKEVLQQTTPEVAESLVNGLQKDRRNLRLIIGESVYGGRTRKCAFRRGFEDSNAWRRMPGGSGKIN